MTEELQQVPRRVIIDTDPGLDDALALLLAFRSPELLIEAITVVAGNVPAEIALSNALRLVEVSGRSDIRVALGARAPLMRRLVTATHVHGENGIGGVSLPAPTIAPARQSAVELIGRIVRTHPGRVSIITIGPLTNLATALRTDPELATLIEEIVMMGGSLAEGNITPAAEFNMYVDPEAARIVFHSGIPLTMIGLNVTNQVILTEDHLRILEAGRDQVSHVALRLARAGGVQAEKLGLAQGLAMHDPVAIAAFIDSSILNRRDYYVDVETSGELTAGETVVYRRAPIRRSSPSITEPGQSHILSQTYVPNICVGVGVDKESFFNMLIGRLSQGQTLGVKKWVFSASHGGRGETDMDAFTIEPANNPDLSAIASVLLANRGDPSLFLRRENDIERNLADFFVARDEQGQVVGCAALHAYRPAVAEILSVAVRPEHQGKGVGKHLVQACIRHSSRRRIATLWLATSKPGYFARFGFSSISRWKLPARVLLTKFGQVFEQPRQRWLPALFGRFVFMAMEESRIESSGQTQPPTR